jgi:butyryl-CoA dehydrogenase
VDFNLTSEQKLLRATVRNFAQKELEPKALEIDRKGIFPQEVAMKIADLGLLGLVIPEEYGGSNMGHIARLIAIEEVSKAYPSMGLFLQATPLGLWIILHFGNETQKLKYIPPGVSGEKIMCMALTEPTGGCDLGAIRTSARRDSKEYIITGSKCFITNGNVAETCVLLAKTGSENSLSTFVVEKGTPGFTVGAREEHMGFRSMEINELFFDDCRIPEGNLIGKEGDGLKAALMAISEIGRIGNAGVALGIADAALYHSLKFSRERKLYGNPIFQLGRIQTMLADMDVEIEAARWLAYYAAWLLDCGKKGREITKEIARAKLFTAEVARRAAMKAVEIQGAYGTLKEAKAMNLLLDSLETIAAAGTNEIMRVIIAHNL